ncbi:hypothetical protein QP162_19625 [Sphingomonas aurantiaca]|uniref:hypothetical protein n=1 Tax=Sphingomonas aurantiaca TaxID=185949 RepID=UPI002FE2FC0E
MTEDDAKAWVTDRFGPEATDRLAAFVDMVVAETPHQNLIAPSTIPTIWDRHVVDSLQARCARRRQHGRETLARYRHGRGLSRHGRRTRTRRPDRSRRAAPPPCGLPAALRRPARAR